LFLKKIHRCNWGSWLVDWFMKACMCDISEVPLFHPFPSYMAHLFSPSSPTRLRFRKLRSWNCGSLWPPLPF
jgi:hypothetical protein